MKKLSILFFTGFLFTISSCKKSTLEVTNRNQPSLDVLNNESGIVSYAKGFYKIGFGDQGVGSLDDGLGYGMLTIVNGFHESMGDNIFIPWGNNSYKFADGPKWIKLDNGTNVPNPIGQGQVAELRLRNSRAYGPSNSFLPEWTYMYFLNNSANVLLSKVDGTSFSGDAETKKNVLKAWAYWWKGYAYCRIGSMYIAGIITELPNATNGKYVSNKDMVTEGFKDLDKAATLLNGISSASYADILGQIIPDFLKPNGVPSTQEWIRNINTFKARTMLVNKKVTELTSSDYTAIQTLVNNGIRKTDYVFMVKTYPDNSKSVVDKDYGTAASYTATEDPTYFPSERLIQDYNVGDKRKDNNFALRSSAVINKRGRGISFGTRWYLVDGGKGNGAYTYFHFDYGVDTYYLGGSYEENELMKAECLINLGQVDAGMALIDGIRNYQGAGLPSSPTGLSVTQAMGELRKERRTALLFRGLAFYDARRLNITDDIDKGGKGRTGAVVLDGSGNLNTNATINYAYLPYWDVPQNELDFNAPASGSAPVRNPG